MANYRNSKLLEDIRQLPCSHCGADDGTVVAAHANELRFGKGRGIKAHDWATAALCFTCHAELDQGAKLSKQERQAMWESAFFETLHNLWVHGIIQTRK